MAAEGRSGGVVAEVAVRRGDHPVALRDLGRLAVGAQQVGIGTAQAKGHRVLALAEQPLDGEPAFDGLACLGDRVDRRALARAIREIDRPLEIEPAAQPPELCCLVVDIDDPLTPEGRPAVEPNELCPQWLHDSYTTIGPDGVIVPPGPAVAVTVNVSSSKLASIVWSAVMFGNV